MQGRPVEPLAGLGMGDERLGAVEQGQSAGLVPERFEAALGAHSLHLGGIVRAEGGVPAHLVQALHGLRRAVGLRRVVAGGPHPVALQLLHDRGRHDLDQVAHVADGRLAADRGRLTAEERDPLGVVAHVGHLGVQRQPHRGGQPGRLHHPSLDRRARRAAGGVAGLEGREEVDEPGEIRRLQGREAPQDNAAVLHDQGVEDRPDALGPRQEPPAVAQRVALGLDEQRRPSRLQFVAADVSAQALHGRGDGDALRRPRSQLHGMTSLRVVPRIGLPAGVDKSNAADQPSAQTPPR